MTHFCKFFGSFFWHFLPHPTLLENGLHKIRTQIHCIQAAVSICASTGWFAHTPETEDDNVQRQKCLFLVSKAIPAGHRMLVPGLVRIHPRSLSVAENHRDASDGTTFSFYLRCRSHHSPVLSSVNVVVERPEGVVRAKRPAQYQIVWP